MARACFWIGLGTSFSHEAHILVNFFILSPVCIREFIWQLTPWRYYYGAGQPAPDVPKSATYYPFLVKSWF